MKHTKRIVTLLLALVMILSLAATAFAQEIDVQSGNGAITVANAAKGETYAIYKLFDASVTGTEDGSIAYTGTIPEALSAYFEMDSAGNITATAAAMEGDKMSAGLEAALKAWTESVDETASAVSDGSTLKFVGLDYGYYVVTTTQGEQAITVDSTNPSVTIVDKNSSVPSDLKKTVDDADVNIGQTVEYTVSFQTSNYDGAGEAAEQIVSYTIVDTLPEFLADVTVTGIAVEEDGVRTELEPQQFDADGKITIDWVDADGSSLYKNGASIILTYTAAVTDDAAIDGDGNTNKVTVTWTTDDGPSDGKLETEETIYTYAIALKKVDEAGENLAGAVFQFPFYVQETPDEDGAYIYAGTEAGVGLVNELTTPDSGEIVVKGVASGEYAITETTAPDGYNKLTAPVTVTAVQTGETKTEKTFYIDADGNVSETGTSATTVTYENAALSAAVVVVVNMTGSELPSTGGVGTGMFYLVGSILAVSAAVLLVTKKRMSTAE